MCEFASTPMGVSQWKEHGKKYGYDKFYKEKVDEIFDQALNEVHGGGNGRRLLIQTKDRINKLT